MSDYWFKPQTYGYGATPANWKGWVALPAFVLVIFAIMWPWFLSPVFADEPPTVVGILVTGALVLAATLAFLRLCKAKTDGAWAWRWGKSE